MNYLIQITFAAFAVIAAAYIGSIRRAITDGKSNESVDVFTRGIIKTKVTALMFDLAILGLIVLFSIFIGKINLAIALAIVYRLFYGSILNYFEHGDISYLSSFRMFDSFLRRVLGKNGGWYQILILFAILVLVNIFWL